MGSDVSIVMTLKDRVSPALKSIGDNTKAFNKNMQQLEQVCAAYEKTEERMIRDMTELKSKVLSSGEQVKETTKAWRKHNDELTKGAMEKAIQEQIEYRSKLKDTEMALNQNRKAVMSYVDGIKKADNTPNTPVNRGFKSIVGAIAAGGIGDAVGQFVMQSANALVGSLGGDSVGNIFSNALSTMVTGASAGFMIAGLPGAAIGAGAGALVGGASGAAQNYQAKDDAFKAYNEDQYSGIRARRADELAGGSATAAKRETDATAFSNSLGGVEPAQAYLTGLRAMDKSTPFTYDDLSGLSKTLLAYGMSKDNIIPTLTAVGDAGAAKGMDSGGIAAIAVALGRMNNTDKANLEYMNLLTERGVDALGWLAERDSSTIADVYDKIRNGEYSGKDVSAFLIQKMSEEFGGMMEMQSKTFAGRSSTLEGWQTDMNSAEGEGYNTPRNEGIARQNAYFEGGMGDALVQMNGIIGAGKAYQENLKEQYGRESMTALLAGGTTTLYDAKQAERLQEMHTEYSSLSARFEAAGENERATIATQIEALKGEAESMAEGAFNASTGMQEIKDVELELIAAIRDNTGALGDAAWNNAYRVAQEQSKGMAASAAHGPRSGTEVIRGGGTIIGGQFYGKDGILLAPGTAAQKKISPYAGTAVSNEQYFGGAGKKAFGMGRVPYDDFPALLHDGERVLTAAQARTADRTGGGLTVHFDGPLTVREEADFGKLARRLAAEIQRAVLLAEPI